MTTDEPKPDRIIRPKEPAEILGVSASTLRRLEQRCELAPRRAISANTRGFLLSEINAFLLASQPTMAVNQDRSPRM
jgi:predicted DNA-binding transcriptional regulator AlpA